MGSRPVALLEHGQGGALRRRSAPSARPACGGALFAGGGATGCERRGSQRCARTGAAPLPPGEKGGIQGPPGAPGPSVRALGSSGRRAAGPSLGPSGPGCNRAAWTSGHVLWQLQEPKRPLLDRRPRHGLLLKGPGRHREDRQRQRHRPRHRGRPAQRADRLDERRLHEAMRQNGAGTTPSARSSPARRRTGLL